MKLSKEELIEKLAEHDLDCFYEQSYKWQEDCLRDIFTKDYQGCDLKDLVDLCVDYGLIEEEETE